MAEGESESVGDDEGDGEDEGTELGAMQMRDYTLSSTNAAVATIDGHDRNDEGDSKDGSGSGDIGGGDEGTGRRCAHRRSDGERRGQPKVILSIVATKTT